MQTPRFFAILLSLVPLLLATQCETEPVSPSRSCEVVLSSADPAAAEIGDEVVLHASPLTTLQDSVLLVGGTHAEVTAVDRIGCDACDTCILEADCDPCGDCDACDAACDAECSETLRFLVPEREAGEVELTLYNLYGNSDPLPFSVLSTETAVDTASD
jgi:hypothetical protein